MRIRKHAKKISPLLFTCSSSSIHAAAAAVAQTHVCQLNQSPWDAITFPPLDPATLPPPPPPFLVDGEFYRSYMENRALANHIAAEQSRDKWDDIAAGVGGGGGAVVHNGGDEEYDHKSKLKKEVEGEEIILCRKTDKKGWQSGERVKAGHSYCERHSSKEKKVSNTSSKSSSVHSKKPERQARPKKPPPPPSSSFSSNPYEFYYYSGFGPRWGKRRGPDPAAAAGSKTKSSSSSSPENGSETSSTTATTTSKGITAVADPEDDIGNNSNSPDYHQEGNYNCKGLDYTEGDDDDEDDYDDFDDDEDDENGEMGKKRARKPIKARSL